METTTLITGNWLTRKPHKAAMDVTVTLGFFLFVLNLLYLLDVFHSTQWMPASADLVFHQHQYWRLWTTLFAHADIEHFLSNAILFFPFVYYLSGYFGVISAPIFSIFMGGVINFFVLKTLLPQTLLIGVSGVVYWLGATWLTLLFLIDQRQSLRRRTAKLLVISLVLFAPQAYKPEVSYFSHALGYIFGVFSGLLYYKINQKKILSAVVTEVIVEDDIEEPAV